MSPFALHTRLAALALASLAFPARAQFEWSAPQALPGDGVARSIATGDVDADGDVDVVALRTRPGEATLDLLRNEGDGSLIVISSFRLPLSSSAVALLDADRDGDDDVVVAGGAVDSISLFLSLRASGLSAPTHLAVGGMPSDLVIEDMDGDGLLDVVVACPGNFSAGVPSGIGIWHGDPAPPYFARYVLEARTTLTRTVAAADMDLDGIMDLVSGEGTVPGVVVRRGDGAGGFAIAATFSGHWNARDVAVADVEGPAFPEIFVSQEGPGSAMTNVYVGTLALGYVTTRSVGGGSALTAAVFADLDRSGTLDSFTPGADGGSAAIENGRGRFVSTGTLPGIGRTSALGDIDGDGWVDVVGETFVAFNRCHEARRGTVGTFENDPKDVLFVNGSRGVDRSRTVETSQDAPFTVAMNAPPARAGRPTRFALYVWDFFPRASDVAMIDSIDGVGRLSMPLPSSSSGPKPVLIWNNLHGTEDRLGIADRASVPAPTVLVDRRAGLRRPASLFLHGVILDPRGPTGRAAATNAVQVISR